MPAGDFNKNKTHCIRGHELTEVNVYMTSKGSRQCRLCYYIVKSDRQTKYLYGLSTAERDALLVEQGSACPICGRTGLKWGKGFNDVWHIDHEHDKPGTHRGILCAHCNTALGRLEPHINKVMAYLAKYKDKNEYFTNSYCDSE